MAQTNPAAAVSNIWKTTELKDKILFTFLCLVIYRLGMHITAPGVDVVALTDFFNSRGGGGLALFDLFTGGGLSKATVLALGIMPYISASIFAQIGAAVIPQLDKMQKEEEGRNRLNQWTRYFTVALAIGQAWTYSLFTESFQNVVLHPGFGFQVQTTLFLTTGAIFVMWLGEQITERGVGNGASLLIFFAIIDRFWPGTLDTLKYLSTGTTNLVKLLVLGIMMLGIVAGVVAIMTAARKVPIQIPQRTMARGRMREAAKNYIPLRINAAGVMPIIFANSVIIVPTAIAQFTRNPALKEWADYLEPGSILYIVLSAVLIIFFTYFYTAVVFHPVDIADNLKKQGGFIPGVKPGVRTAEYIESVMDRITFPGALFLTVMALLPVMIAKFINVPFRFGGTSLLIVVGVALDTITNMNQHLLLRKYDGFMKKGGRVRYRGGIGAGAF